MVSQYHRFVEDIFLRKYIFILDALLLSFFIIYIISFILATPTNFTTEYRKRAGLLE
jgi:hypothetical protein